MNDWSKIIWTLSLKRNAKTVMLINLIGDIKFVTHTSLVLLEGGFFEENLVNPFLLLALLREESFLGHLADSQKAISQTPC